MSRGDSSQGEDITENINAIASDSFPNEVKPLCAIFKLPKLKDNAIVLELNNFEVRGELILPKHEFETVKDRFKVTSKISYQ